MIKAWLKDAFEWFYVFLIWPYILIKGAILAHKVKETQPIDKIARYQDEIKSIPIEDWDKVYDKYFGEDVPL